MSALTDIWHSINAILTSSDVITLVIMAVIAIAAGYMMQGFGSIISVTVVSLAVYALVVYGRALAASGGKDPTGLAQADWHTLMGWQLQTLIAYAIAFAVVIAIVNAVKSGLGR